MRIEISERAERDIADITRYTFENFGRGQVDDYIGGLFHSFDILTDNPQMGQQHETIEGVRRYIFRMHHVFYQVREHAIRIAHIRHTSQKPPGPADLRRL